MKNTENSGWTCSIIDIELTNERIRCTAEHPFWVSGRGWVQAGELSSADILTGTGGSSVPIVGVSFESLDECVEVYGISVDGEHMYFAGDEPVLVHNKPHC